MRGKAVNPRIEPQTISAVHVRLRRLAWQNIYSACFCHRRSRVYGPPPAAANNKKVKQNSTANSPRLSSGQNPRGAWPMKYATAISPDSTKAIGRVNTPNRMPRPPKNSKAPANHSNPGNGADAPPPPIPPNQP